MVEKGEKMPRLKLIEMDSLNKMIYFRKDDKLIAFDADVAIELISDSLDGKYEPVRHGHWCVTQAYPHTVYCSECFQRFAQAHWAVWEDGSLPRDYCPHCGAKMDERRNDA